MKNNSNPDFTIEGDFAFSLQGGIYSKTKLDGNLIHDRKWFQDNLGRKIKRVDSMHKFASGFKKGMCKTEKITNKMTWQGVSISEIMYRVQFVWNCRYKLVK